MGKGKPGKMGVKTYPKRGEIYLVSLDPTLGAEISKTRPALIISNDINNQFSDTVTVIPITSYVEKTYPFEVLLPAGENGLSKNSKAKCNQIRTIDKQRLVRSLGKLRPEIIEAVEEATKIHLKMT
jgi:mRNA interferase MazF